MKKGLVVILICCICVIILIYFGCKHFEGKNEEMPNPTEDSAQSVYERNIAIIQNVEGYSESDAKAVADLLPCLIDIGTVPNGEILFAEKFIWQSVNYQGELFEKTYLHFRTADNEDYYARLTKSSRVYVIYKGPIENNEYVWAVIE